MVAFVRGQVTTNTGQWPGERSCKSLRLWEWHRRKEKETIRIVILSQCLVLLFFFIVLEIFAFQNNACSVLLSDDLAVLCTGVVAIPVDFSWYSPPDNNCDRLETRAGLDLISELETVGSAPALTLHSILCVLCSSHLSWYFFCSSLGVS